MPFLSQLIRYTTTGTTKANTRKLLLSVLLMILYRYRSNAIGTHCRPDLKGPRALPLLGHTLLMAKVPGTALYEFFEKLHDTYGPVWSITVPNVGRLIQGDTPELVDYVLRTNFWNYEKSDWLRGILGDVFGTGITIADGHNWKFQRKMITRIFNVNAFREYVSDVFVAKGQKVVDYLGKAADEGTVVDINSLLLNFALDAFGTISFGWNFGSMDSMEGESPLGHTFDSMVSICSKRALNPVWRIKEWMTGTDKKLQSGQRFVAEHMASIIQKRREQGFHGGKKDLLQLFLEATDDDGNPLSDSVIQDFIVNITVAGRDAVPQSLSWMIYCLHRTGSDPKVRENLVREIDEVLQGKQPTYDTYKNQKYAEACFHESLRLFPIIPRNMKKCMKDDVLPDGTKIHAGDWFTWSPYVMGRSERIWGEDAKEYKPSRWINAEKPSQAKFNAFNLGPRVCAGQQFGTVEGLTVMAMIFSKFTIELVDPDKQPGYLASVALQMSGGLPVRVQRRFVSEQ